MTDAPAPHSPEGRERGDRTLGSRRLAVMLPDPAGARPAYHPYGLPDLRAAVAERFTRRGLATVPEQILVTSGAQHALTLVLGVWECCAARATGSWSRTRPIRTRWTPCAAPGCAPCRSR
ncbi:hypothetical protein [Streptomyces lydicus]|uniref:hypothetical protein n=1 Tax=Streptomyces lydicus TaxID=47763 RepID=UPI0037A08954